jgi:hypothetical protein
VIPLGVLCALSAGAGQGFSDLEGQRLSPVGSLESAVGDLLRGALGGDELEGSVDEVVVVEDGERTLELAISMSGFADMTLSGDILDSNKRKQPGVATASVAIEEGPEGLPLAFHLDESLLEGDTLESAYLRLSVLEPRHSMPVFTRLFRLPKTWQAAGGSAPADAAESVVVLDPVPRGDTPRVGVPIRVEAGAGERTVQPSKSTVQVAPARVGTAKAIPARMATVAGLPKIDLYGLARNATWRNGAGQRLTLNGPKSATSGFVAAHARRKLADGKEYSNVLQVHPEGKTNGRVTGTFEVTIPDDAEQLRVGLGFLPGANGSDGVLFTVSVRTGSTRRPLLNEHVKWNQVTHKTAPIATFIRGQKVTLELTVYAGASADRDRSVWIHPRID